MHFFYLFIQRIFGIVKRTSPAGTNAAERAPLEKIRQSLQQTLHDCTGARAERVTHKIKHAQTPAELWQLRSDLHQCIAQAHSQSEAAQRVNSLIEVFRGWLPASQLTRI